jgi:hypothetical protein
MDLQAQHMHVSMLSQQQDPEPLRMSAAKKEAFSCCKTELQAAAQQRYAQLAVTISKARQHQCQ